MRFLGRRTPKQDNKTGDYYKDGIPRPKAKINRAIHKGEK